MLLKDFPTGDVLPPNQLPRRAQATMPSTRPARRARPLNEMEGTGVRPVMVVM